MPSYPALDRKKKVSAAWLVEHSGFSRGYTTGHVGISSKHSLAIINRGGATAVEVLALKDLIQQRVDEDVGPSLNLEPETVFVGSVAPFARSCFPNITMNFLSFQQARNSFSKDVLLTARSRQLCKILIQSFSLQKFLNKDSCRGGLHV